MRGWQPYLKLTPPAFQIPDLVSQRRRWLNGSFFASLHATFHFYYLYRSRHSATRKFFLHILILYQAIQLVFSWFAIGNYFIGAPLFPWISARLPEQNLIHIPQPSTS